MSWDTYGIRFMQNKFQYYGLLKKKKTTYVIGAKFCIEQKQPINYN